MTELLEEISNPVPTLVKIQKILPASAPVISITSRSQIVDPVRAEDISEIPFDKWVMPPQPEGYIKSTKKQIF